MHNIRYATSSIYEIIIEFAPSQAHASLLNVITVQQQPTKITSFHFLPDSRKLILILRGGDMHSYSLETDEVNPSSLECSLTQFNGMQAEVEGSIEAGILSAEWSPDDELLSLITGSSFLSINITHLHRSV